MDPNLKTNFGHPIEAACSIKGSHNKANDGRLEIVANREIDEAATNLLGEVYPMITKSCFQNLDGKGETFSRDLNNIATELHLGPADLVIVPTSYSNEIIGTKRFVDESGNKSPKFVFQIHQFFPPTQTFEESLTRRYFLQNKRLLSEAFSGLDTFKHAISVWSTESNQLNMLLNSLSPTRIGKLPLPIEYHPEFQNKKTDVFTISFLGDGRYEKGLLLFLESIQSLPKHGEKIVVQDYNSRGYKSGENTRLNNLIGDLENSGRIQVIRNAINPVDFQRIITESDLVVMPYHPKSYDKRVSEVYIIAKMYNRDCVVSSGTWMAEESKKFGANGVFTYDTENNQTTIDNLREELQKLAAVGRTRSEIIDSKQADYYKLSNSPEELLGRIKKHYE